MTEYVDKDGNLHREDGPAQKFTNGDEYWYYHGLLHRENGPAITWANGVQHWFNHGRRHRLDGPAMIYDDRITWYINHQDITKEVEAWLKEQGLTWPFDEHAQVAFVLKFSNYLVHETP